tara:strand:+ start:378 stop:887 length:510 start_codon:yes stop_codon:yes gene_type:complete
MGQDNILELFFEEPNRLFQIREIGRLTKIPKTTVERRLKELVKEKLIFRKKENVVGYIANENEKRFRLMKRIMLLEKIEKSGLIEELEKKFYPKCIILFGSFSKGEHNRESDIDLFVQSKEKNYDLSGFERKLKHTINLFFEEKLSKLSDELFNNIINGIKLAGYIKLR